MSRQQRDHKRRELPPEVWADPAAWLRQVFGEDFQAVAVDRTSWKWWVRVGGRDHELDGWGWITSRTLIRARQEIGLEPLVPSAYSVRITKSALRRQLRLQEVGRCPNPTTTS